MKLDYVIQLEKAPAITGSAELEQGELRIHPKLPKDKLRSVTAKMKLEIAQDEKLFFNGYQTWTYCPEYSRDEFTRGMGNFPKPIVKHYGIDRYGDYFFVDYPQRPGFFHGESYCYFRRGDEYRLIASLDEKPGYTMFSYDASESCLSISRDCAGLCCEGEFAAFDLFFAQGDEDSVFDAWFKAMGIKCTGQKPIVGYTSWYNLYQKIDEKSICTDLAGCVEQLQKGDLFQIDDGWEPAVGDWLDWDRRKFPSGMKSLVQTIHQQGLMAGLWLAPFVCQKGSKIYKEHKDWLLKIKGKPWYCGCNWGGFYALDIDNPQVVDYLERCFDRILNDWGFDLVKLDFLYAAAPYGSQTESRAGRMTRAMELLRRLCGDKLILGCGVPLMPAFGLVDYCRISCDVGLDWDDNFIMRRTNRERVSTRQAVGNSIFRRQLNGRAFLNDPDVFILRQDNVKLSPSQKHVLATVNSLFGSVLFHSDNMAEYTPEAKAQYRQLLKNQQAKNICVNSHNGLSVSYQLDGVEQLLIIE